MRRYDSLTAHGQHRRIQVLAERALARWPGSHRIWKRLDHGENTTFRVVDDQGGQACLRVHRPGYHAPETIRGELAWLRALRRDTDLVVPRPLVGRDGDVLQLAVAPGVPEPRWCSLLEWVGGRFLAAGLRPVHLRRVGELTARLHAHAAGWDHSDGRPRVSPREYLAGESPWGDPLEGTVLENAERTELENGLEAMYAHLDRHPTDAPLLVHADLHHGNYLFSGGRVGAIDFDDCLVMDPDYDFAVTIRAFSRRPDYEPLIDALFEGYGAVRPLPPHTRTRLPAMFLLRQAALLSWVSSRQDNPGVYAYLSRTVRDTMCVVRAFQEGRVPVLEPW